MTIMKALSEHAETRGLSPRSALCRPEPAGLRTPYTEGLTSYVCRLARMHTVSFGLLFENVLLPALGGKKYLSSLDGYSPASSLKSTFRHIAKSVNGLGSAAFDWIKAVEALTLRPEVLFLTLVPWADVLPTRNLLRPHQAWCPECYHEWAVAGREIYTPLLWSVRIIEACVRHGRRLEERCPGCLKRILPLSRRSFPGYCPRCNAWLGIAGESTEQPRHLTDTERIWQATVERDVGWLISSAPVLSVFPTKDDVAQAVRAIVDRAAGGVMTILAKHVKRPKTTVWCWYHGVARPNLEELLRLCQCVGLPLSEVLSGEELTKREELSLRHLPPGLSGDRARRKIRKFDPEKVEAKLLPFLDKGHHPVSMREVARRVGIEQRHLYLRFPDLCRKIAARYAEAQRKLREEKRARLEEEVAGAYARLESEGTYVSKNSVALLLGKHPYRNRRDVGTIIQRIRESQRGNRSLPKPPQPPDTPSSHIRAVR